MKENMKRQSTGANGRIAGIIIAISIVLLAAVMPAVVSKTIPAYENTCLGWRPLVVRTNSMEGKIRKNAVIIVYAARWDSLEVNDIITFELPDGQLDTHRVISKDGAHIVTKGDNAPAPDTGWVTPDNYKYKVMLVMNWVAWLSDHRAAAYLICLPALLVALVTVGVYIARRIAMRRQLARMETEARSDIQANIALVHAAREATADEDDDGSEAWVDEMIVLLEPLLARPQDNPQDQVEEVNAIKVEDITADEIEEKETPYEEPQAGQAFFADDDDSDSDLDWDAWALRQLRQPPASPRNALPAIG